MIIKGYVTKDGYMGFINDKYVLFATEDEYLEAIEDARNKEEEIKVGDEVKHRVFNQRGIAMFMPNGVSYIIVVCSNGDVGAWSKDQCEKTGRHFPQIEEVVEAMRN